MGGPDLGTLRKAHDDLYRSFEQLVGRLTPDELARPTGCPGWTVADIIAHVVGLEAIQAGEREPDVELPTDLAHVRDDMGRYMETHVHARRGIEPAAVLDEARSVFARRGAQLAALTSPEDEVVGPMGLQGPASRVLRIRIFDMWAHEQDVRRVVQQPGHRTGPAVDISLETIRRGLVHQLPARLEGADGTVAFAISGGPMPGLVIDLADASAPTAPPRQPTVTIELGFDDFVALACGRADAPRPHQLACHGDRELGARIAAAMAVTP